MLTFRAGAAAITAAALTGKPERVVKPGAGGTGEHPG